MPCILALCKILMHKNNNHLGTFNDLGQHWHKTIVGKGCLLIWDSHFNMPSPSTPARRFSSAAQGPRGCLGGRRHASPGQISAPVSILSPHACGFRRQWLVPVEVTLRPLESPAPQIQKAVSAWEFISCPSYPRSQGWVRPKVSSGSSAWNCTLAWPLPLFLLLSPLTYWVFLIVLNKSLAHKFLSQGLIWGIQLKIVS